MSWFDVIKEKRDYRKDAYNKYKIVHPKSYSNLDGSNVDDIEYRGDTEYVDAQTGEVVADKFDNLPKGSLMFTGYKAAMSDFSNFKSANSKDYYEDIAKILTKYSKTRNVQPHRNYMEEAMSVYWTEHLNSLKKLYNVLDTLAKQMDTFPESEDYLQPSKDSNYVLEQIKNVEAEDNKALLGKE
tara:strand:+ start:379 stop:930 length:552 start_codon:yes stop_codon:yes gene_type:complete